jgi:hypothetical protein
MAVTKAEARQLALDYLQSGEPKYEDFEVVLLDDETIERAFGWVFFFDSKRHVETGDYRYALAGNAPIVVTKADGQVHQTGTAYPIEHYLKGFESD